MMRRGKKTNDQKQQYLLVIGLFCAVCVFAVLYTVFNPKPKLSEQMVIDDAQIMIHNGQGHQFKHGKNTFFEGKALADAKQMFMSALSDTN